MSTRDVELVRLTYDDAETVWKLWTPDGEDVLARAAFDRTLRWTLGLEDEGLYFRPGGWTVDAPAALVRVSCAAGILAAGFQIAGLEDLNREIIIAVAGLVSSMELRPARLTRQDRKLAKRLQPQVAGSLPLSASDIRRALPRQMRKNVSKKQIEGALERLVAAGVADRAGDEYTIRAAGGEAWIRITFKREDT